MNHTIPRKSRMNPLALAFAIPFLGMLLVMAISQYMPFGKTAMLYSDMYHQYYPFFVAFRDALRSGDSLLYNWSVGMGMDYLGLISYYLASPLYLLAVLVPKSLLLPFFSLLMPIKLGLASLFFALLLKKLFGKNDWTIAIFGAFYGLCAWALGYQWNIMWLDSFALTPLVILGEILLLRDKRFILYTLTLFLALFSNYYIGFFVCIFVALVFLCYEICRWRGFARFFADLFRIALFSALAIVMTAVLELPAFAALQNTQSSVNAFPQGFRLNIASKNTWLGLLDAMRQVAGNTGGGLEPTFKEGLPNLYCGVGVLMLAWISLTSKEISRREKLCSVFLLLFFAVSFIVRQLDYIWHGFHFTNMIPYRFSFLFSFVVLIMGYRAYLQHRSLALWQVLTGVILEIGMIACSNQRTDPVFLAYNVGFVLLFGLALAQGAPAPRRKPKEDPDALAQLPSSPVRPARKRVSSQVLLGIFGLEIALNLMNFGIHFPGTAVSNYPKGTSNTALVMKYLRAVEDDSFYRMETAHSQTLNDGALIGYHGVSTFTSSANVRVTEFMKALGYGAKNTYNRYCFEDSSPVSNLFLGLKYMVERDGNTADNSYFNSVFQSDQVILLENQAYLPLGFLAEPALEKVDFQTSGDDPFAFQDNLFTAATGVDEAVWHVVNDYEITAENATLVSQVGWGYCSYEQCQKDAAVVYTFRAQRSGLMCMNLNVTERNSFTVSLNDQQLYTESLNLPQMLSVSEVSAGDVVTVRLKCKDAEQGNMTVRAAILDANTFWQGYDVLRSSVMEVTQFSNTQVVGNIHCDRDGLLYTSIPQDGNWRITVDGQEVTPVLVGDAMIGLSLSQGDHTIVFSYHNSAFTLGWQLSLAALAVFVVLSGAVYLPKRNRTAR